MDLFNGHVLDLVQRQQATGTHQQDHWLLDELWWGVWCHGKLAQGMFDEQFLQMAGGVLGKGTTRFWRTFEKVSWGHLQDEFNVFCALQSRCLPEPRWGILCQFTRFGIPENLCNHGFCLVPWGTAISFPAVPEIAYLSPCGPGNKVYFWVLWHLLQPNDVRLPNGRRRCGQSIQAVTTC